MRVPNVTLDMLVAIIALAEKKNLEPAGKELGISPAAVHKRIQAANQIFGTRLFLATNDGFELTEIGRTLYSHATLPLEQVILAEETTRAAAQLHASHLLVGHSTYIPARLLALIHSLPFASALGIRLEHKAGLTSKTTYGWPCAELIFTSGARFLSVAAAACAGGACDAPEA